MITREKDPDVLQLMMRSGSGFAANLASAWLHADPSNSAKLFLAFGDLYDTYEATWRRWQDEHAFDVAKDRR